MVKAINKFGRNVNVLQSVETKWSIKILFSLFIICITSYLFYIAIEIQYDKPTPLPFLIPIVFCAIFGKFCLWNIFGEEYFTFSISTVVFKYNYGLWMSKETTETIEYIISTPDTKNKLKHILHFCRMNENGMETIVFSSAISFSEKEIIKIFGLFNELKINQLSRENDFPIISLN